MNCPFHIKIYQDRLRSYRELPLRWAELGTVYRYERSGALHGLMRVRGFTQDDAHLFVTEDQVADEVAGCLEIVKIIFAITVIVKIIFNVVSVIISGAETELPWKESKHVNL